MTPHSQLTENDQAALVELAADLPGEWITLSDDDGTGIFNAADPRGEPMFHVSRHGAAVLTVVVMPDGENYAAPLFNDVKHAAVIIKAGAWFHAARKLTNAESGNTLQ